MCLPPTHNGPARRLILVDPALNQFIKISNEKSVETHYPTVSDLINRDPELIANNALIINWAHPNSKDAYDEGFFKFFFFNRKPTYVWLSKTEETIKTYEENTI